VCVFSGCQSTENKQETRKPVFFPPPPERPRLQFLKSFSGPQDLGAVGPGAFETFVLGEPETKEGITRPYGVAIFEGKLYVCDVGKRMVEVLDLKNCTFGYLTKDRRLMNGAVFVFDRRNNLKAMLGKELKINPIDVVVRGPRCYVTDFGSNQVVVLDKTTGREIARIGKKSQSQRQIKPLSELPPGEITLISDLALDQQDSIYVTDKAAGRITQFDRSGIFKRTIGRLGLNIDELVRPKGIAIDKENRIWVVDAGPDVEVAKIYNQRAQLLLFFGLRRIERPANSPGMMNLPAKIVLDYDNVELFREYAVEGANIEFLVLVSNQYGLNKINVYGFGSFPGHGKTIAEATKLAQEPELEKELKLQMSKRPALTKAEPKKTDIQQVEQQREIAELYYRSIAFYRAGQLEKAREGFDRVLKSRLIPIPMAETIGSYLADIDNTLAKKQSLRQDEQQREIAELYYRSIAFYRAGQLEKAREGLAKVLKSGLIPALMAKTVEGYLADIDNALARRQSLRP
jgi:YVTN family beta-propeller protein